MAEQVEDIRLHLTKLDLECQKLALELTNMKKPWWRKPGTWALLVPIVGGLITGGIKLIIDYSLEPVLSEKAQETVISAGKTSGIIRQEEVISAGKTTGTSQEPPSVRQKDKATKREKLLRSIKNSL